MCGVSKWRYSEEINNYFASLPRLLADPRVKWVPSPFKSCLPWRLFRKIRSSPTNWLPILMRSLCRPLKRFYYKGLSLNPLLNPTSNTKSWKRNMSRWILRRIRTVKFTSNRWDLRIKIQMRICLRRSLFYFLWKTLSWTGSRSGELDPV